MVLTLVARTWVSEGVALNYSEPIKYEVQGLPSGKEAFIYRESIGAWRISNRTGLAPLVTAASIYPNSEEARRDLLRFECGLKGHRLDEIAVVLSKGGARDQELGAKKRQRVRVAANWE